MSDEFVDLYEVLGLPLDADREVLRKRINEKYLEAQRNLDHRNFQTRVKFQEMFEVTMPQARYILLDAGRRAEYDNMVRAMRTTTPSASSSPPPTAKNKKPDPNVPSLSNPAFGPGSTEGFRLAPAETGVAGQAPTIDPLPVSGFDSMRGAKERDDLWRKWKSGLEEAIAREKDAESAAAAKPIPTVAAASTSSTPPRPDTQTKAPPQVIFASDSDEESDEQEKKRQLQQQEQRRTEHRRQLMKDMLEGVGLKGMVIGAAAVLVPGVAAMIAFMLHYYPRNIKPLIAVPQNVAWMVWGGVILIATFVVARLLSKSMKRNMASELAALSYEALVKRASRS